MKTFIIFFAAVTALSGTYAMASTPNLTECQGLDSQRGHLIKLHFIDGHIETGARIEILDLQDHSLGGYQIANVFSPNFQDLSYGLEFRGGFSFNYTRLSKSQIDQTPMRLQRFKGLSVTEIPLACTDSPPVATLQSCLPPNTTCCSSPNFMCHGVCTGSWTLCQ